MSQQALNVSSPYYAGALSTAWRLMGRRGRELKVAIALRFIQAMCAGVPIIFLVWTVDGLRHQSLTAIDAWIATAR